MAELEVQELFKRVVGDSTQIELWADEIRSSPWHLPGARAGTSEVCRRHFAKEPFAGVRDFWERTSNSIMADKDFAVGGGKI